MAQCRRCSSCKASKPIRRFPRLGRRTALASNSGKSSGYLCEGGRRLIEAQGLLTLAFHLRKSHTYFSQRADDLSPMRDRAKPKTSGVPGTADARRHHAKRPRCAFLCRRSRPANFSGAVFVGRPLGVDIRGRSRTLKVNYRTSHQIRQAADRLMPKIVQDVDGNEQDRRGTVSVFNGPDPEIQIFADTEREVAGVTEWIKQAVADGIAPAEIGLFVRSNDQLARARAAVKAAGHTQLELSDRLEQPKGRCRHRHHASCQGLGHKAVAVMACDDDVLPLQERIGNRCRQIRTR